MCCWMGSHFNDWTDYNGLAFAMELHRVRRMGFAQNFEGKKIQASGDENVDFFTICFKS